MTEKQLMRAIGNIDEKYIVKYADVSRPSGKKRVLSKILSLAACMAVIITAVFAVNNFLKPDEDFSDISKNLQYVTFEGMVYEVMSAELAFSTQNLPNKITDVITGDKLGSGSLSPDGQTIPVYDCTIYNGVSLLIADIDSALYYLSFLGAADASHTVSFAELLSVYGLNEVTGLFCDKKPFGAAERELMKELALSSPLTEEQFTTLSNDSFEHSESREIIITGENAEALVLTYYPTFGCVCRKNNYYSLTPAAVSLLNE